MVEDLAVPCFFPKVYLEKPRPLHALLFFLLKFGYPKNHWTRFDSVGQCSEIFKPPVLRSYDFRVAQNSNVT